MVASERLKFGLVVGITVIAMVPSCASAQTDVVDPAGSALPKPNPTVITEWADLPKGRTWGSTAGIDIGPDGHVWTYDRCGAAALAGGAYDNSDLDPILKFHRETGEVLNRFGAGMFVLPHGFHLDQDGNVWVTDS